MPELSRYIGEALIISRGVRGMSQYELAKRAGIRQNQISRYETGAVIPQITQLERIFDGLGIGYVEFFYVVSAVERIRRVFRACDQMEAPEALAVHGALLRLTETADAHLRIAEQIEGLFGHEKGALREDARE